MNWNPYAAIVRQGDGRRYLYVSIGRFILCHGTLAWRIKPTGTTPTRILLRYRPQNAWERSLPQRLDPANHNWEDWDGRGSSYRLDGG